MTYIKNLSLEKEFEFKISELAIKRSYRRDWISLSNNNHFNPSLDYEPLFEVNNHGCEFLAKELLGRVELKISRFGSTFAAYWRNTAQGGDEC